jgi:hypothetical protein
VQLLHANAKARHIECVDGESSVTALRAAQAAGEKISGTASSIGERSIDDLDEFCFACGQGHKGKDNSHTDSEPKKPRLLFGSRER